MSMYGNTLRMIRQQKGITLKKLADNICSVSFLSKFERGDSNITLGLMTRLLEKLMIHRFHEEFTFQKEFNEFIAYLESIAIPESNLIDRVHLLQLKGAYVIRTGNKKEGIVKQAIQLLNDLNSTKMANNIEQYLLQII